MKRIVIITLFFLLTAVSAMAQVSGETETVVDGKGHPAISQYVFFDAKSWNGLVRYYGERNGLHRGEFAVGPTVKVGKTTLKLQFGGTTKREVMTAGVFIVPMGENAVVWIVDAKFSTTNDAHTLYQKLWVPLNRKGRFLFRIEDLQVGSSQAFLRIGAELRWGLPHKTTLFVAPFGDPKNKAVGFNAGLRY